MARFRDVDMQSKFIPVDFAKQILPGTFEHALHVLIDDELDLSPFSAALKNDLKVRERRGTGEPGVTWDFEGALD